MDDDLLVFLGVANVEVAGSGGSETQDPKMTVVYIVRSGFHPTKHSATGFSGNI